MKRIDFIAVVGQSGMMIFEYSRSSSPLGAVDAAASTRRTCGTRMAGITPRSVQPSWLHDANSMLVSACCHFAVLILIAFISIRGAPPDVRKAVVVELGRHPDSAPVEPALTAGNDGLTTDALTSIGPPPAAVRFTPNVAAEFPPAVSPASFAANPKDLVARLALGIAEPSVRSLSEAWPASPVLDSPGAHAANGGGRKGAKDAGKSGGATEKASTAFFGIDGYGQSFVYVVDCSGSMNDNGKFDQARYELLQSITKLKKDQKYFVIFYNHQPHPMDGQIPVEATPEKIADTTRWVMDAEASGGTYPLPALQMALSLRPDAIYFLSDGQFDPRTADELRRENRANARQGTKMIPIHTIAFYDRFAAGLMRAIAKNSGGEFKFVQ